MIARIAGEDREALAVLYHRHAEPLLRYLLRLTANRGQAEEILQDTFVAVWRGAARYAGRSTVRTWLIGIARRQAHNRLRRHEPERAEAEALDALEAPDPDPERAALLHATRDELLAALDRLSPVHREALALAVGQALSTQEIADLLHVPVGTVKSRLRDAKRALRAHLRAYEEEA